jgi:radical SAM-linked protein
VTKAFLVTEYEKYLSKVDTPDCRYDKCSNCGVCDFKTVKHVFAKKEQPIQLKTEPTEGEKVRYLLIYEKTGDMRYIGMLDMMRLWHRLLRIVQVPLIYTKGFNPQPVIDGGWALPLGVESHCEVLTFEANRIKIPEILERFNKLNLSGLKITHLSETAYKESVDKFAKLFEFKINLTPSFDNTEQIVVKRKGGEKIFDAKAFIKNIRIEDGATFFTIEQKEGGLKPLEFASFLAKRDVSPFEMIKTKVFLTGGEVFGT